MVLRKGRWLVFLVLSAVANVLIASAVTLIRQPPPQIPVLTVNLVASAAPAAVPQAVPEPQTEPAREPIAQEPVILPRPAPQPKQPVSHVVPEKPATPPVQKVVTAPQAIQKVVQKEKTPQKISPRKALPQMVKPRPETAKTPLRPKELAKKEDLRKDPPRKERVPPPKKTLKPKARTPKAPQQTVGTSRDQGQEAATVLHEAHYRQQTAPLYPRRALDLGQQGTAILHVEVTHNGFTRTLKVAQSSGHRLLDRAALAAVRKWEFEPTQMNGKRITSWVRVPVSFIIQSSQ